MPIEHQECFELKASIDQFNQIEEKITSLRSGEEATASIGDSRLNLWW